MEREALQEAGIDVRQIHTVDTLIRSDEVFFAATGISGGTFLRGVEYTRLGAVTHSMVIRGKTGSIRYIESLQDIKKLMKFSSVKYD